MNNFAKPSFETTKIILKNSLSYFVPISAIGGFVADVISPLAPFSLIIFILSTILSVVSYGYWAKKIQPEFKKNVASGNVLLSDINGNTEQDFYLKVTILSFLFAMVFLLLFLVQQFTASKKGLLAEAFPQVASIQASIIGVKQSIKEIEIKIDSSIETQKKTTEIAGNIASTVVGIGEKVGSLTKMGGVIPDPETEEEIYHNILIYERNSKFYEQKAGYEKLSLFREKYVDVNVKFMNLIKFQEGIESARSFFSEQSSKKPTAMNKLLSILLLEGAEKNSFLETLIQENPDFGPGYYYYSKELEEKMATNEFIGYKFRVKKVLDRMVKLNFSKDFQRYFFDKEYAQNIWEKQAKLFKELEYIDDIANNPGTFNCTPQFHNNIWRAYFYLGDGHIDVSEFFWKTDKETEFKSLGHTSFISPKTRKPQPESSFNIDYKEGHKSLFLKFKFFNGEIFGPYEYDFDTEKMGIEAIKNTLLKTDWSISYIEASRDDSGKRFFTTPSSGKIRLDQRLFNNTRQWIQKFQYSFSNNDLNQEFVPSDVGENPSSTYLVNCPDDASKIYYQVIFVNGDKSDVMEIGIKQKSLALSAPLGEFKRKIEAELCDRPDRGYYGSFRGEQYDFRNGQLKSVVLAYKEERLFANIATFNNTVTFSELKEKFKRDDSYALVKEPNAESKFQFVLLESKAESVDHCFILISSPSSHDISHYEIGPILTRVTKEEYDLLMKTSEYKDIHKRITMME